MQILVVKYALMRVVYIFKQFLLKCGVNDVNIYETEADVVDKPLVSICQKKLL